MLPSHGLVFSGFVRSPASHLPLIFSGALGLVLVYPHRRLGYLFLVANPVLSVLR